MALRFFEFNDKPAYTIGDGQVPFVLQYNDDLEQEWMPNYDAGFGSAAVPITKDEFVAMAGDMARRLPVKP